MWARRATRREPMAAHARLVPRVRFRGRARRGARHVFTHLVRAVRIQAAIAIRAAGGLQEVNAYLRLHRTDRQHGVRRVRVPHARAELPTLNKRAHAANARRRLYSACLRTARMDSPTAAAHATKARGLRSSVEVKRAEVMCCVPPLRARAHVLQSLALSPPRCALSHTLTHLELHDCLFRIQAALATPARAARRRCACVARCVIGCDCHAVGLRRRRHMVKGGVARTPSLHHATAAATAAATTGSARGGTGCVAAV